MPALAKSSERDYYTRAANEDFINGGPSTRTKYLYDQAGHIIAESSDSGTTYTEYLWLGDTPVALIKPGSSNLYYIHPDHLDTPRLIANQTPAAVWRWDNDDPFGANMANANPSGLGTFVFNLRLPGLYFDSETGYQHGYFRDYSVELGRFLAADPLGVTVDVALYAYAGSSPIDYYDEYSLQKKKKSGKEPPAPISPVGTKQSGGLGTGAAQAIQIPRIAGPLICPLPSPKIQRQMGPRGWSQQDINNVLNSPAATSPATNRATGNPATAYFDPSGSYVVQDNETGQIVQISNRNDPNWKPDPSIQKPYTP